MYVKATLDDAVLTGNPDKSRIRFLTQMILLLNIYMVSVAVPSWKIQTHAIDVDTGLAQIMGK